MRNAKNMKEHIMKTLLEKDKTALLSHLAQCKPDEALALLNASENGLSSSQADKIREHFGANSFMRSQKPSTAKRMASAFVNIFTVILFILALIEFYTQVLAVPAEQADPTGPAIIALMVIISGILRFIQETKSNNAAQNLQSMISSTCCVVRDGKECEIPMEDAVVGDIVLLAAGDMVPADMRSFYKPVFSDRRKRALRKVCGCLRRENGEKSRRMLESGFYGHECFVGVGNRRNRCNGHKRDVRTHCFECSD